MYRYMSNHTWEIWYYSLEFASLSHIAVGQIYKKRFTALVSYLDVYTRHDIVRTELFHSELIIPRYFHLSCSTCYHTHWETIEAYVSAVTFGLEIYWDDSEVVPSAFILENLTGVNVGLGFITGITLVVKFPSENFLLLRHSIRQHFI